MGSQAVTRKLGFGKLHEPTEELTIDVPRSSRGAVTQPWLPAVPVMVNMHLHNGTGWVRMEFKVPSRGTDWFEPSF